MKHLLAILLVALVVFASLKDATLWLAFKLNQQQIAEKWCINKLKPNSHCDGKCYFYQQLEAQRKAAEQQLPMPQTDVEKEINLANPSFGIVLVLGEAAPARKNIQPSAVVLKCRSRLFINTIFHPPEVTFHRS